VNLDLLSVFLAAEDLERWLSQNTGTTADWPIEIKADEDGARDLSQRLNALRKTLDPVRRSLQMNNPSFPEHVYEYTGIRFFCRDGTNEEDVVRSILQTPSEYGIPKTPFDRGFDGRRIYFDIGAHIGVFGVSTLVNDPAAEVVFVEPLPANINQIHKNLGLNEKARTTTKDGRLRHRVVRGAVGDSKYTQLRIALPSLATESGRIHQFVGAGVGMEFTPDNPDRVVSADVVTMRDLFTMAVPEGANVFFIKIDCEGGEYPFFQQADPAQLRRIGWIVGEYHSTIEGVKVPLEKAGFRELPYEKAQNPNLGCFRFFNPKLVNL